MPDQNNPTDVNSTPTQVNPLSEPTQMPAAPPPFPPEVSPPEGAAPPPDSGSAAPSFDIPPVITPSQPKKKFGGKKVIATILGLLVLVGGLGAGVILVRQQQDIREKAAVDSNACERAGLSCYPSNYTGCTTRKSNLDSSCGGGKICGAGCKAPPAPEFCTKDCVPQSECKSGTQVGGVGYGDCGAGEYCCDKKAVQPPTLCPYDCVPQSQCKAGGKNLGLGYGDCGAVAGEYCCETAGAPAPSPDICALAQRDPNSQGYCDRSAPNTPDCTDKTEGTSCNIRSQCGGGTGKCVVVNQGGANAECQCQKGAAPPTPTKTPTPTEPPGDGGPTAQCLDIKAFDVNWTQLTVQQLSQLKAGNKVRFTVAGQTSGGSFDKARFKINGVQRPEVTGKRPGTEEYFDEYTIPAGALRFVINAQIHHTTLGWSN